MQSWNKRNNVARLGITLLITLTLYSAYTLIVNSYTTPTWKWIYIPSCKGNEAKIGIRSYISPFPYPGARNDKLVIEFLNPGDIQENLSLHIHLPPGWLPTSINRSITLVHGVMDLTIPGLYIPENTKPSTYQLGIVIERFCSQGSAWRTIYVPVTIYNKSSLSIKQAGIEWSDGYAYPGLRNEILVVKLRYDGPYTITSYVATVSLPRGIHVSDTNLTSYTIERSGTSIEPGDLIELRIPVDIEPDTTPGNKTIQLELNATIEYSGASLQTSYAKNLNIRVDSIPSLSHKLVELGWATSAAFPGEKGVELLFRAINTDDFVITNAYIVIELPEGITHNNKTRQVITLKNIVIGYGDILDVQSRVDVSNSVSPGTYYATINALLYGNEPSGAHGLRRIKAKIPLRILPLASLSFKLINAKWSDDYAYPGEINAELVLLLRSLTKALVNNIIVNITIPALNVTRVIATNTGLEFGSLLRVATRITIPNNTRSGNYLTIISIRGIINLNNQEYLGLAKIATTIDITSQPSTSLEILDIRWKNIVIGNETFAATPQVLIRYWGKDRISSLIITISNVTNAELRGGLSREVVVYSTILEPGVAQWYSLPALSVIDTEKPVTFNLSIVATATTPSGGIYSLHVTRLVKLLVALERGALRIAGIEYITKHLLPGARSAEISLRIANIAPEPVYIIGMEPVIRDINATISQNTCTTPIPPGQACTITISLTIPNNTKPGMYRLGIRAWYSYQSGEDVRTMQQYLSTTIIVEDIKKYAPSISLQAYWAPAPGTEPVPVLPGDIAPLQLVIYNRGPSDVKGLSVEIDTGNIGKILSLGQPCSLVPSGSSCTITAYLKINESLSPGIYVLRVSVSYIFSDYTVYKILEKQYTVTVQINSDSNAIRIAYSYWLTPPQPGTRSAELALYLVTDPHLVEKILSLKLLVPPPLFSPDDNSTIVVAMPASSVLSSTYVNQLYRIGTNMIRSIMPSALAATNTEMFIAKMGVKKNARGLYKATAIIYWVDRLGTLRETRLVLRLPIIGGTPYIEIKPSPTVWLKGGVANLSIKIINTGNMPIYNVYVTLIPTSYTAYPSKSTVYFSEMLPGHVYNVTYTLNYNPTSFGQQSSYTFSGILAVLYESPTGLHQFYNTTVSVVLRPAIKLVLNSLRARWHNGSLVVEGVIANMGIEQAKTVSIRVVAANNSSTTLVGDIDAGSEAPFRVVMNTAFIKNVTVMLTYHDIYGTKYSIVKTISVVKEVAQVATETSTSREGVLGAMKALTLVLILAAIFSSLYLYRRIRHSSVSEET